MYCWPPNVIRTPLETGPRILLSQGEVLAPFYITQNTRLEGRSNRAVILNLIFKVYKPWGVVTFLAQVLQVTKFISLFPVNSRNL